jgi:uncharacterized repeat protein (TIGR01451 family)
MPMKSPWKSYLLALSALLAGSGSLYSQETFSFRNTNRTAAARNASRATEVASSSKMNYFPGHPPEDAMEEESESEVVADRQVPMREQNRPPASKATANQAIALPAVDSGNTPPSPRKVQTGRPLTVMPQRTSGKSQSMIPVLPAVKTRVVRETDTTDTETVRPVIKANHRVDGSKQPESGVIQTGASERTSEVAGFENYLEATQEQEPAASDRFAGGMRREDTAKNAVAPRSVEAAGNGRPVKKASAAAESEMDAESRYPNLTMPTTRRPSAAARHEPSVGSAGAAAAVTDEGTQTPGITLEWVRSGAFNVGQLSTIELIIRNTMKSTVSGVEAEVSIPASCEILEMTPPPSEEAVTMRWSLGTLHAAESRTIRFQMIPHTPGDAQMHAAVRMTGTSTISMSIVEPMLELAVTGPEAAEAGEQLGYLVQVSNPGSGTAENVVILASLPEGLEHKSGKLLNIGIGTLNPGESRQAKLSLTANRGGQYALDIKAQADGDLLEEVSTEVTVSEPQLQIEIAGPNGDMAGRNADYRVHIENAGSVPSTNVRAKYKVPDGYEFVSANRGGRFSVSDQTVEWFVGTLQPEQKSEFLVTMRATVPGQAIHQAGVISEHGQVTMCEHNTEVEGAATLEMKMVATKPARRSGDESTWQVRLTNTGTSPAKAVGMSCELPPGVTLLDVNGPTEYIAENGVLVFRSLPELAAGDDVTFEIRVRCNRAGNHRLRMRIASTSLSEPLIGEEGTLVAE